nr:reverse transcriptase domain-containing protein [Tanacetum cinerariifolium]
MLKYGVTHHLYTAYHLQISGQVEVSNRGLKCILERIAGENRASRSDKLDDALWAFRTAFKAPIGYTPYKFGYGKACHLPIELEHKAYWALKHCNFNLKSTEKTKKIHDSKIKNRVFNVGDRVLLFNSRLKIFLGKLKTRWTRPFIVTQVFPYGTFELSQTDKLNFKTAEEKKTRKIDRLARSLLIQGLPNDIYSLIDSNKTAKDLRDTLERQMRGFRYGEQDRKAAILYEYETFKANEGEQLLDTYLRYLQVINDLKKCGYKKDKCPHSLSEGNSETGLHSTISQGKEYLPPCRSNHHLN